MSPTLDHRKRPALRRRPFVVWVALLVAGLTWAAGELAAADHPPTDAQVKAAFIYRFATFIEEWPAANRPAAEAPITFGYLGDDPVAEAMTNAIPGKIIRGHPLVIRRCATLDDLKGCQVLFVSPAEKRNLREVLETAKALGILTVGDAAHFTEVGGMINFVPRNNKVHFEINNDNAEQAKIKISSELLKIPKQR